MTESVRIREIRQDLAELRDPGAHDGPGHALFLALQKSYIEDLALLGASIQPEETRRPAVRLATIPVKPVTKPPLPETKPPTHETKPSRCLTFPQIPETKLAGSPTPTQEVRHADSPGNAGAPGATSTPEAPMSKPHAAAATASPEEQLDTLLAKLSNATADCVTALNKVAFQKARAAVHQHRWNISKLLKAHDLEAPVLPAIPSNPWAKPITRSRKTVSKQSAPPPAITNHTAARGSSAA
jgi:hypothetical protein